MSSVPEGTRRSGVGAEKDLAGGRTRGRELGVGLGAGVGVGAWISPNEQHLDWMSIHIPASRQRKQPVSSIRELNKLQVPIEISPRIC